MKGAVYELKSSKAARGHEQRGNRLAVVVLASRYEHLSQWLVVPTSTSARPYIFRPEITVPARGTTLALCDALVSVDPEERLGKAVASLSLHDMQAMETALANLLDLT